MKKVLTEIFQPAELNEAKAWWNTQRKAMRAALIWNSTALLAIIAASPDCAAWYCLALNYLASSGALLWQQSNKK